MKRGTIRKVAFDFFRCEISFVLNDFDTKIQHALPIMRCVPFSWGFSSQPHPYAVPYHGMQSHGGDLVQNPIPASFPIVPYNGMQSHDWGLVPHPVHAP
mmetsp:Transcript_27626/g.28032  ORF Transcript_27626/g.28032 Transcript_27626/m.28032 type:complete len:99 (+) Transcript_27626:257-553(+)